MIDLAVSDEVISDFAKAVVRKDPEPEFITVNGIARKYDDEWMIELDGSQQLTPIASSAVGLNDGDRVTAQIKNHSLSVTGNLTGKTTTQTDTIAIKKEIDDRLDKHDSKITEVEDLMATKVNTDELNAQKGRIDQLVSDNATIREKLTATDASIDKLDADVVDINDSLTAKQADIDSLKTSKIDATVADAKYATIGDLDAANASINNLDANYADFKKTTTDTLDAVDANIKKLNTDKLNVTDAAAKYANIDFANIGEAAIKAFYAKSGVISDVVISDGHVTGKLVGVTIKGDLIEGGTVVADKLVMLGEDGLYYKLNTNGKTVSSEQTEYNSLNGSIITAKSITAEKVNVNDLVAFGATIGGLHISNGSLYSGAKNAVSNTTNGVYMDSEGQFALGNASNFLKFYKDGSGKWKLVISADAMTFGTGGSVEDAINESAKTVTLQYYRSTSATSLVGGSWADSSPEWVDGTYIWTRSKSVDRAGNATYSEPACITGNTGATGPQGKQGTPGIKGADGTNGTDGVGISSVTITYGVSSSSSTHPTSWQTTVPTVPQGQYLWTRTITDYTSDSVPDTVTYTYALQGKDGAKGATGSPGAKGDPGKDGAPGTSVKVSSIQYQVGSSGTTPPTGTWSSSVLATSTGQFLWTKTTFSDGNVAYGVAAHGAKGDKGATGATGNGISSVTVTYGVSTSASAQPSSWQTTIPTVPQGQYLWTRTVTDYTDPSVADTVTYTYSLQGKDGAKGATGSTGATGSPGKDGTSVKVSSIQYQVGTSPTTAPTGTWSNSVLATSVGQYLWTKTTFSDGNVAYGVAAHGSTGPQGAKGADGKSPTVSVSKSGTTTTITVHNVDGSTSTQTVKDGTNGTPGAKGADGRTQYLHVKYSNDNGASFTSNSGETVGSYIGTCTDFNEADPTSVSAYKWARIKGDTGAKGDPGAKGATGAPGVGVSGTTVTYQSSSSGTTIPTGTWSSTIPSVPEGSFLWTRIVYSYSNGTSTTAYSVGKMGAKGDKGATGEKGATGATGAPGAAGRGIKSSNVTYQAGNSQTSMPTGSWSTSVPKLSSATPYLWTRTILTYTDNTSTTAYSVGTTLDGVNVGGRNLLRGTDYEINTYTTKTTDNASWGSGFNFDKYIGDHGSDYEAFVPYGYSYRASVDVLIPVDGNIVIDINNYPPEGEENWSGNDNDNGNRRTSTHFSVKANVWTRISWGSENTASGNTKKLPIRIVDSVGLLPQSKDVTWSYRGLKVELGNTATDWSPAPEDVATDIADAANTAANALEKANNNEKNITEATKAILNIQENIKALVTGPNGSSLMTQTNKGWTFDMSSIERTLNEATDDITNLNSDLSATNDILNSTKKLLDDVTKKTAYINFATDDSGNPCIELGKQDNPFKLRITNTSIDFMQGSQKIAYLTNHQLYIESSVITDSILIGQNGTFIWKKRANNHLGLRYT